MPVIVGELACSFVQCIHPQSIKFFLKNNCNVAWVSKLNDSPDQYNISICNKTVMSCL